MRVGIPVGDVLSDQFVEPGAKLREDIDAETLFHLAAGSHDPPEIALAKLLDDVVIIGGFFEIEEAYDVIGVDLS